MASSATIVERPVERTYFRGGRQAGTRNKVSTKCKANIEAVFNGLGGWEEMLDWAKAHKDIFYGTVYPRLLATEQESKGTSSVRVLVYAPNQSSDKPLDAVGQILADNGDPVSTQNTQAETQTDENNRVNP